MVLEDLELFSPFHSFQQSDVKVTNTSITSPTAMVNKPLVDQLLKDESLYKKPKYVKVGKLVVP
jgi:hypothetical protein